MQLDFKWVVSILFGVTISLIAWFGNHYLQVIIDNQVELKQDVRTVMGSIHQIELDLTKKTGIDESLNDKIESVKHDIDKIKEKLN